MAYLTKSAGGQLLNDEEQEQLEIWYDGFVEYHELTFSCNEDRNDAGHEIKQSIFKNIGIRVPIHEPVKQQWFVMPELLKRILTALFIIVIGLGIWIWFAIRNEQKDRQQYNSVSAQSQHPGVEQASRPMR